MVVEIILERVQKVQIVFFLQLLLKVEVVVKLTSMVQKMVVQGQVVCTTLIQEELV